MHLLLLWIMFFRWWYCLFCLVDYVIFCQNSIKLWVRQPVLISFPTRGVIQCELIYQWMLLVRVILHCLKNWSCSEFCWGIWFGLLFSLIPRSDMIFMGLFKNPYNMCSSYWYFYQPILFCLDVTCKNEGSHWVYKYYRGFEYDCYWHLAFP